MDWGGRSGSRNEDETHDLVRIEIPNWWQPASSVFPFLPSRYVATFGSLGQSLKVGEEGERLEK